VRGDKEDAGWVRGERNLWNNLLQPVGRRTLDYRPTAPIVCPSRALPYLATKGNSPGPAVP